MKTQEELSALKIEAETLNRKLAELSKEELAQVTGGSTLPPGMKPIGQTRQIGDSLFPDMSINTVRSRGILTTSCVMTGMNGTWEDWFALSRRIGSSAR